MSENKIMSGKFIWRDVFVERFSQQEGITFKRMRRRVTQADWDKKSINVLALAVAIEKGDKEDTGFVIVAYRGEEELGYTWAVGLDYEAEKYLKRQKSVLKCISNCKQIIGLSEGAGCAVHAHTLRDFIQAYYKKQVSLAEWLIFEGEFAEQGHVILKREDTTTPWMNVAYLGPFYGVDTAWWFGKGEVK